MKTLLNILLLSTVSLYVTGCGIASYSVNPINLYQVKKQELPTVRQEFYSKIYDNQEDLYLIYGAALGAGDNNQHIGDRAGLGRASVIYASLKYGEASGYKYITFVYPYYSSSLYVFKDMYEDIEEYLRKIISNTSISGFSAMGNATFMFEGKEGDEDNPREQMHKIGVMYFKEQPLQYRTYSIQKVLYVLDNYFGLKDAKIFNIPVGIDENRKYTNLNSPTVDLKNFKVEQLN